MNRVTDELERGVLRLFFESVSAVNPLDNSISDSKIIRDTQNKLKTALCGAAQRCSCVKRTWGGPCEVCQASDNELYHLRNFFRVIRKAKKHNMTAQEIQDFVANTNKWATSNQK